MLVTPPMTNITGWTVVGDRGVDWMNSTEQTTTHGNKAIDLQGRNPPGQLSSMWTMFPTSLGAQYLLQFDSFAGNRQNQALVSCGSLTNQRFSGPTSPGGTQSVFAQFTYAFTATSTNSTLLFTVASTDGYGPVVDNVYVGPPRLRISRAGTNSVRLNWPNVMTNYVLESVSVLAPGSGWSPVSNVVTVVGSELTTTNAVGSSPKFYRLKQK